MQSERTLGRRRFLTALGAVGATTVAGCLGGSGTTDRETETANDAVCRPDYPTTRHDIDPFVFTFVAPAEFSADEVDIRPTFGVFGDFRGTIGDYTLSFSVSQGLTPITEEVVENDMENGPPVPDDRLTFFPDFTEYDGRELDGFHYRSYDGDTRPYPEIFWIPFTMPSGDLRFLQCEMGLEVRPWTGSADPCPAAEDRLRATFLDSLEPNEDTTAATLF